MKNMKEELEKHFIPLCEAVVTKFDGGFQVKVPHDIPYSVLNNMIKDLKDKFIEIDRVSVVGSYFFIYVINHADVYVDYNTMKFFY